MAGPTGARQDLLQVVHRRAPATATQAAKAVSANREFWERHPKAREPLLAWFREVEREDWDTPGAVKAKYRNASILGGNRVVFNVKGNAYRLVVKIKYAYRVVYVRFVGTHAEYDAVDAKEV